MEEEKRETERLKQEKVLKDALAVKEAERILEAQRHENVLKEDQERYDREAIAAQETAMFLSRRRTLQTLQGIGNPDDPANYESLGFSEERIQQLIDASKQS